MKNTITYLILLSNVLFASAQSVYDSKINTIDGVRVDYENCWGLVRASNTTPCLVLRFEANDNEALNEIKTKFAEWLKSNGISADSL